MKKWIAAALAALTALTLTGCSFQDVMLYLRRRQRRDCRL